MRGAGDGAVAEGGGDRVDAGDEGVVALDRAALRGGEGADLAQARAGREVLIGLGGAQASLS